jgi:signal transduction histidine kinase
LPLQTYEKEESMIVEDNGRVFSPIEPMPFDSLSKRLGLLGIRELLTLVSGTLEVESVLSQGCTLYIQVPL